MVLCQNDRVTGSLDQFYLCNADVAEVVDQPLCGAAYLVFIRRIGADGRDTEQVFQFTDKGIEVGIGVVQGFLHSILFTVLDLRLYGSRLQNKKPETENREQQAILKTHSHRASGVASRQRPCLDV